MRINHLLDKAQGLLDAGESRECLTLLLPAVQENPEHVFLQLYTGLAQVECGQTNADREEGLARVRRAIEAHPRERLLPVFYARALYDAGEFGSAREQCIRVEAVQPGHPGAVVLRLLCDSQSDPLLGFTGLAILDLPDDAALQGRVLMRSEETLWEGALRPGDSDAALPGPISSKSIEPLTPEPVLPGLDAENIAPAEHESGMAGQPLAATLPDRWPDGRMPWSLHAGVEASAIPASGVTGQRAWQKRAQRFQETGHPLRAIPFAEAAMREKPDDGFLETLAPLYFEAGRYAETEAALRGRFETEPYRNTLVGISLFHLGDYRAAIATLRSAEPDSVPAAHALGRSYLALGEKQAARQAFVRTAHLDRSLPPEALIPGRVTEAYLYLRSRELRG